MQQFDYLVIGGGIAGAGAAYHLADRSRVLILERETFPGHHTTGRSAAVFDECYGNAAVRALTRASRAFLMRPPAGFADAPLLTPRGNLYVAREDQLAALEAHRRIVPPRAQVLDTAQARRLVPLLHHDYVAAALLDDDVMDIDVHALHQGFLRGAKANGAVLRTAVEVRGLARQSGLWHARTSDGVVAAAVVVDAAGAWADMVGILAGVRPLGLQPLRRTAVLLDVPVGVATAGWPMVRDADETFYFKPDAGRLLASPADETPSAPCDAQPEEIDVAVAVDRIQRAADIPVRRVARSWAGLRSFVVDRTPVVGFDRAVPGFFWLAGQGGYGIQTAAALAQLAGALASGADVPPALAAFDITAAMLAPDRPALAPARPAEAVR